MDPNSFNAIGQEKKRGFLRIPLSASVKVIFEGGFIKKVRMCDLSTVGLAIFAKKADILSDEFEVEFRLKLFTKPIKTRVQIKHKAQAGRYLRIGCGFTELSEKDGERIGNYIMRYASFGWLCRIINFAGLLCSLDALIRISGYLVLRYYQIFEMGEEFRVFSSSSFYLLTLWLYAFTSFISVVLTGRFIERKQRTRFSLAVLCLVPAFIFALTKNFVYWSRGYVFSGYFVIKVVSWIHFGFVIYVGTAFFYWLTSVKKINVVLDTEYTHRSYSVDEPEIIDAASNNEPPQKGGKDEDNSEGAE